MVRFDDSFPVHSGTVAHRSFVLLSLGETENRQLSQLLFQLPNPLLQELPLWFLVGQRQSFLIRGPN